ncbi:MAG: endolytic transglycosylase MltG [Alphaproteobacteria bacterium CG_4_9_14_3_um_filter_47_13]|nr:MAG: endolytic transglycosylase MltG [Alphaproteobacteria bacterium CG_4_9_14_3_um_filter_47_13]
MKNIFIIMSFALTLFLLVIAGAFLWGYQQYNQKGTLAETRLFQIEKGQGVVSIADNLATAGIITRPLLFRIVARMNNADRSLQAGEYEFSPEISMAQVLQKLVQGDIYQRQFTIPEGLTSWQIVQILNRIEALPGTITEIPAEGSLLPETYNYFSGETKQDKINQMQEAMTQTLETLWLERKNEAPVLSKAEVMILASIVEKETAVSAERRRIAGVFLNRLKMGIKLQTDPTVIYALTSGKIREEGQGPLGRRLLGKDLQFESPYNTYKYPGLPPGPIANPGKASLAAVLDPEIHDYYYFVADGTGGHVFSKTLEEHNRNVARWRKIRKQNNL